MLRTRLRPRECRRAGRLRRIRGIDERHRLTLMCRDLSEIARYAIVDDAQFKLLKSVTPGSYTFILRARREVPRRLTRKKTIGVRVPGHLVAHALLAELGEHDAVGDLAASRQARAALDPPEIRKVLEHELDLVIDGGPCERSRAR